MVKEGVVKEGAVDEHSMILRQFGRNSLPYEIGPQGGGPY